MSITLSLREYFPQADDLLSLPPHELSEYVLKISARQRQNKIVHLQVWRGLVQGDASSGRQGFALQA
ncbi:MAG: hypothetical protein EOO23_04745, partial [Comamonadaceae bacterium]